MTINTITGNRPFTMAYRDIFAGLDATEKGVVLTLMDYGDNIFPSHERLSADAGIPVRSLKRVLDRLRAKGKVFWRSMGRTNHYYVVGHNAPEDWADMAYQIGQYGPADRPIWPIRSANMADKQEQENQTHKREQENQKPQPPAATEGAPMPVGAFPEEPEEPRRGFPLTFSGTVDYFTNEARKIRMDGDVRRVRAEMSRLHKEDGLSYDEIHGIVRMFFAKYERDLAAKRGEYSAIAMFQQMHRRLVNQRPVPATGESVVERVQREDPAMQEIRRLIEEKRRNA